MDIYITKINKLAGTNFKEVHKKALYIYNQIRKKSKRRPYIKSSYFSNNKVFLAIFWGHLYEKKNFSEVLKRIKFYPCALDLIQNSRFKPDSKVNPNKINEILHRFYGMTRMKELFCVQIKENIKTGQKNLISIFPKDK